MGLALSLKDGVLKFDWVTCIILGLITVIGVCGRMARLFLFLFSHAIRHTRLAKRRRRGEFGPWAGTRCYSLQLSNQIASFEQSSFDS